MILALGNFIFSVDTAAYQTLQLSVSYPWVSTDRFSNSPGYQAAAREDRHVSLTGTVYPTFRGAGSLDDLRLMASAMTPLPVVDSRGHYLGLWVVKKITETRSLLLAGGTPRKQDFVLELMRYDDTGHAGYNNPHR